MIPLPIKTASTRTSRWQRRARLAASAMLLLAWSAGAHAQAGSDASCPQLFRRPEVLDYVNEVLGRLEKQRTSWRSPQVVRLIGQELPSELRLKTPYSVLQTYAGEIDNIRRETMDACWPSVRLFLAELDATETGYVSPGPVPPVASPTADGEIARRLAAVAQWQADEERARQERQVFLRDQEAARRAAEEERNRAAAELRRRDEEAFSRQRAEAERLRQEREQAFREQEAARIAALQQAQGERDERARLAELKRRAELAADQAMVDRSSVAAPERRLTTAYRRFAIVQQCYDAFAGKWFGKSYLNGNQLALAKTLLPGIETGLLKLDGSLNRDAIRAAADREEQRLATDPDSGTDTARGPIRRKEWSEASNTFCAEQIEELGNEALRLRSATR